MDPTRADFHALVTLPARWPFDGRNGLDVSAGCLSHPRLPSYSCSARCTKEMAMDPSPTADATRLILPPRTSPTVNTPGRFVSRRWGARASGQRPATKPSGDRSGPVLMNPLRVECTTPREPACVGYDTGHGEDVADGVGLASPRLIVPPA